LSIFDRLRRKQAPPKSQAQKPGLIGLDIRSNTLHLCQLRPETDNRFTIIAKSSMSFDGSRQQLLESPKDFKRLLAKATQGKKFKGNKVTAIMPPDDVRIMLLTYKSTVSDVDAEIIKMLTQRVKGNIDDYVVDYLPVRNSPNDEEHIVMASVALRSRVERFLATLSYAGLQVHSLDIGPSALRRLISVLYTEDKKSNVLLVNTAEDSCFLTIISGRRLLFDQPVSFGCNQLLEDISKTLDLPVEKARELVLKHGFSVSSESDMSIGIVSQSEVSGALLEILKPAFMKLAEEINRVLIFTASETRGIPLSRVFLLGCMARFPGAHELMMSLLDVPVEKYPTEFYDIFLDENEYTTSWSTQLPELAIATGLALRGLQPDV
jgi:type IV pilus assembly protein PilM